MVRGEKKSKKAGSEKFDLGLHPEVKGLAKEERAGCSRMRLPCAQADARHPLGAATH